MNSQCNLDECGKCRVVPQRFNQWRFCSRNYGMQTNNKYNETTLTFAAVKGQIIGRESVDGWVKYRIAIDTIFKRETDAADVTRGETSLWQTQHDFLCKCPKLRLGKHYLLLGVFRKYTLNFKNKIIFKVAQLLIRPHRQFAPVCTSMTQQ
jgi:netrin 1